MKRKRKEGSQGAGNSRSTAAMLLCVLLAVTAVAAGTLYAGEKSAKDDKAQAVSVQNEDVQTVNEGWQEAKDNPLREETDSGITKAVRKYYEERTAQSPFAEGYENLKTYTKRGKYKDTYLAFVSYDMKIKDIYTMAPGLEILYIEPDEETGELCVEEEMPDQETRETSQLLASQEDAGQLMTEVQAAYDGAVASDAILAEALSDLEEASEASAGQQ